MSAVCFVYLALYGVCGKNYFRNDDNARSSFIYEFKDRKQTDENRITSRTNMLKTMCENNADILLHGHTHELYINRTQATPGKTCWIMNPGSIRREIGGIFNPVYGVLKFDESGIFEWHFVEVE